MLNAMASAAIRTGLWPELTWPQNFPKKIFWTNALRAIPKTGAMLPALFPLSAKNLSWPYGICCPTARKGGRGSRRIRSPRRFWLRKYLPHAVPGHCVGLPVLSLLSLVGSSLFSSPEFHYITENRYPTNGGISSIGLTLDHAGNFVPPWKRCHSEKSVIFQIFKGSVLFFGMDGLSRSWRNEKHVKL